MRAVVREQGRRGECAEDDGFWGGGEEGCGRRAGAEVGEEEEEGEEEEVYGGEDCGRTGWWVSFGEVVGVVDVGMLGRGTDKLAAGGGGRVAR